MVEALFHISSAEPSDGELGVCVGAWIMLALKLETFLFIFFLYGTLEIIIDGSFFPRSYERGCITVLRVGLEILGVLRRHCIRATAFGNHNAKVNM